MTYYGKKIVPFTPDAHSGSPRFNITELKEHNVIGKKLAEARKMRNLSQKDLSAALTAYGASVSAGAISKWEKGDAFPGVLQFLAFCDICRIDQIGEFFLGETPEAADYSPELNQKGLKILQAMKEAMIASGQYVPVSRRRITNLAEEVEKRLIRVSSNLASAGTGSFLDEDQFTEILYPVSQIPDGTDFGIRISGDSMEPVYMDRQIVWVQQCSELNPGEVGIFICDGEGYIKEYHEEMPDKSEYSEYFCDGILHPKISLISYNKKYPSKQISPYCRFEIIGRVLN
ncbi:MAG: XRE family transcriptional regulator [Lachnospiraceae bacterium]|nr:XRE family transcriptional regulator [Lachnospiraceae bacterium]